MGRLPNIPDICMILHAVNFDYEMKNYLTLLLLSFFMRMDAQDSARKRPLQMSGYAETYYVKDFNNPEGKKRAGFLYNHNRSGEPALNLIYLKAAYTGARLRTNLALAAGTYMQDNFAAEKGIGKNIYEANAGIKILRKKELWVDAGVLSSHIGFESAAGKDCWTLTRSLMAENSPYYETGIRVSFSSADSKWYFAGLVLNGWQRIRRLDGSKSISFGTQVTWKPTPGVSFNSSTFIGNDRPDSLKRMRYFHSFYGIFPLSSLLTATAGLDAGMEQVSKGSTRMNTWYSPVLILRLATSRKTTVAARVEYYSDKQGIIIATGTANGFQVWGLSANFDVHFTENIIWRTEARNFSSRDPIFPKESGPSQGSNFFATTAFLIGF